MLRIRLLSLSIICFCTVGVASALPADPTVHPGNASAPSVSLSRSDRKKVGELFMAMCLNHFEQGKLEWAEQACSQALEANPHLGDAYKLRGYAYLMDHRFERAEKDFHAALRLKPRDDQNIAGYGQSLSGQGRFSEAASQFRLALSLAPERASYWNGLCWSLAGEGHRLHIALDSCNRALALAPGAAGILNSRAMVYLRLHRFSFAIDDYSASLDVQQDQASAWFGRGLARLALDEKQGSSDILEARHRDPGVDGLFIQMGVLPRSCTHTGGPVCPPGFPAIPDQRQSAYRVAMLHADADQELVREIRATHGMGR